MNKYLIIILTLSIMSCSANNNDTKKEDNTQNSTSAKAVKNNDSKKEENTQNITSAKAVSNLMEFDIPKDAQDMMELGVSALKEDSDGNVVVPNKSIVEIDNKKVVFLSLGNEAFTMRDIKIIKTDENNSFIKENLLKDEKIVVEGADKIRNGILRMMSQNQNTGHSHGGGAGSHAH